MQTHLSLARLVASDANFRLTSGLDRDSINMNHYQPLWTLADYERFLDHPASDIRFWAKSHIEKEYPEASPRLLARLADDPDALLQFSGIEALGKLADAKSEAKLLQLLPQVNASNRGWIITYLAQMHSATFLPVLLPIIASIDLDNPRQATGFAGFSYASSVEALGAYDEPAASELLWRVIDHSKWDGYLSMGAVRALFKHPQPQLLARVLRRLLQLNRSDQDERASGWQAIAAAIGVEQLFGEVMEDDNLTGVLKKRVSWENVESKLSAPLLAACAASNDTESFDQAYFFRLLEDEFQQKLDERGDNLAVLLDEWQRGVPPVGYAKRTLYSWQLLHTAQDLAPTLATAPLNHQLAICNLALLAFLQFETDENDEKSVAAASDEVQRQAILLDILAAPRQNVLATIVDQVSALGAAALPRLAAILRDEAYWPRQRALHVITTMARAQPGAADALIMPLIDLLAEDGGDFLNEACADALRAIGPAVVEPLAAAMSPENLVLEIYGFAVIADIPALASVDALERYIARHQEIDTDFGESLVQLGQPQSIKFLLQFYDGKHPRLARALYTIGLLNGLESDAMTSWANVIADDQRRRENMDFNLEDILRGLNATSPQTVQPKQIDKPQAMQPKQIDKPQAVQPMLVNQAQAEKAAQKARKQKRNQAKATQKAQKKAKKKKR